MNQSLYASILRIFVSFCPIIDVLKEPIVNPATRYYISYLPLFPDFPINKLLYLGMVNIKDPIGSRSPRLTSGFYSIGILIEYF